MPNDSRLISWRLINFELPVALVSVIFDRSLTPLPLVVLLAMLLLLLVFWELERDDIGVITVDLPAAFIVLRPCAAPIELANNANWPRRPPAVFNAVITFCCCIDRLFACELFKCHASIAFWRAAFIRVAASFAKSLTSATFCTAASDGKIIIGDGLRSIFINFNPLKCSAIPHKNHKPIWNAIPFNRTMWLHLNIW